MGTPERDEQIVRFYMQHVVALNQAWDEDRAGVTTRRQDAYTCFVLEMWGRWFLVTAGHVLLDHLYSSARSNVKCSIFDAWKKGASQHPIPFTLPETRFALNEDGLDLGLIPLDPIYRRAMEANGIKAFDERVRQPLPPDMFRYAVLGLPDQFIQVRTTSSGTVQTAVNPTFIYLSAVEPPSDVVKKSFPCFYGKLADHVQSPYTGEVLKGMKGFSGGPILGFKRFPNGQVKYYLVAIQSGWWPGLRIVFGPLIPAIAAWLEKQIEQAQ